ncbi:hypothetical protein DMB45_10090 [Sanguibacteroides justesenii]|uniref:translocation/assembly module TamB domain-containing protein n=1 Tax=Sanguibacteroides justesenii TaxID=1547597 RepID=UPI000D8A92F5|nr:translocation/assembly module TamB domain-containing protein [Sanguibacteroides justesenii]PXZ43676.1 hypothetical protein DMB45_10090 [Sanguibacteroides justesenii]
MKVLRKVLKYILRGVLFLWGVIVLLVLLLYIPAVQDYVKTKVESYAAVNLGVNLSVKRVLLKFPLDLYVEKVYVEQVKGDTLLAAGQIQVNVSLLKLLKKEVEVRRLLLEKVVVRLSDSLSGMKLDVVLGQLRLQSGRADLSRQDAEINSLSLTDGKVEFRAGERLADVADTATTPLAWRFLLDKISLENVNYEMMGLPMGKLRSGVGSGTLDAGLVDMGRQSVAIRRLELKGAYCELRTTEQEEKTGNAVSVVRENAADTAAWEVKMDELDLKDGRFKMGPEHENSMAFPEVIDINSLAVAMDSIYNRGTEIATVIKSIRLKEKNGLDIRNLSGRVKMGEQVMIISDLAVETPYSHFSLQAKVGSGLSGVNSSTPMEVLARGSVSGRDIALFVPDSNNQLKNELYGKSIDWGVKAEGTRERVNLEYLRVHSDAYFSVDGNGTVAFWNDPERLTGTFDFIAEIEDSSFLSPFLMSDSTSGFRLPSPIEMDGGVVASHGDISFKLGVTPGKGAVELNGNYGLKTDSYRLDVNIEQVDLAEFFPGDSLGMVSMNFSASGRGWDWERAVATSAMELQSLVYRGYLYENITLNASLEAGKLEGKLQSPVEDMSLDLNFGLDSDRGDYRAVLDGEVHRVDLRELHFMPDELAFASSVHLDASLKTDGESSLQLQLSEIKLNQKGRKLNLGKFDLSASSGVGHTDVNMETGDLRFSFKSCEGREELIRQFTATGERMVQQIKEYALDMDSIRGSLPDFRLYLTAGTDNLLNQYLKMNGILFKSLDVDMRVPQGKELDITTEVRGIVMEKMRADSLLVRVWQEGAVLKYGLTLYNSKDIQANFSRISLSGGAVFDQLYARLKGNTLSGKTAVNVGMNFTLRDSVFTFNIASDSLIFGYLPWQVNQDNYLRLSPEKRLSADLQLTSGQKRFKLLSFQEPERSGETLSVDIQGIEVGLISEMLPFIPNMAGIFSAGLELKNQGHVLDVTGNIRLDQFFYEHRRVGNLELDAGYRLTREQLHEMDFALHLDGEKTVLAKGKVLTGNQDKNMSIDIDIPKFPLRVVNAFIPSGLVDLQGDLRGTIAFRGDPEHPLINGGILFQQGRVTVLPVGTLFQIDSNRISIADNRLSFNGFGLIAPNRQRMELQGDVNFASFSDIRMNTTVNAKNFQVIKVNPNDTTMVYGKAFIDLDVQVKGALNALFIRGNVGLLDNSVINYVLKSSPLEVNDKSSNIVRFVSFRDTTLAELDDRIGTIQNSSLDILLLLNISPLVNLNVLLSDNGQNRVVINGGGELTYSLSPLNESRLVGKYVLTGGSVNYSIPVIGEKVFTIQDGNFVEWTGDMANPMLNITAAENISANVSDDNQNSRMVNFKALIRITNTLQHPDITFDLSATGDMTIQNQLAAMTPEERSKEAMNLMIYGSYNGPGTVAKSNASNNALNGLIEKELNQWSRRYLKGMDLSFGINTYNQTTESGETQKTDYSYQFSKRLFNNKVRVKVGGRISTDNDPAEGGGGLEENLIDDISVEYLFGKNPNFFLKIFRHTGYESVLEGEVTQTGIGVVLRKKFQKFLDLFRKKSVRELRNGTLKTEKEK